MSLRERLRSRMHRWMDSDRPTDSKMQEIQEYDVVRLRRDLRARGISSETGPGEREAEVGLAAGTEGTVLMVFGDGTAFEVEVVNPDGSTLFLGTLSADDLEWVWRPGGTT